MVLRVGLIGLGAIGTEIAKAVARSYLKIELTAVYDLDRKKAESVLRDLKLNSKVCESFEEFIKQDLDLVVEAASQEAVKNFLIRILESGKDVLIMSTGALADKDLLTKALELAEKKNCKIYLPSGAIGGLDIVKAASFGKIKRICLRTTKNPRSLKDAPYVKLKKIDLSKINSKKVIYRGKAEEAVKYFPANVNVAATLGIAGIGIEATTVEIVADPNVKRNIHEILVEGEFGKAVIRLENEPFEQNPKTSKIAAFSAIMLLKRITSSLEVGT